jgi:hypothetical protein
LSATSGRPLMQRRAYAAGPLPDATGARALAFSLLWPQTKSLLRKRRPGTLAFASRFGTRRHGRNDNCRRRLQRRRRARLDLARRLRVVVEIGGWIVELRHRLFESGVGSSSSGGASSMAWDRRAHAGLRTPEARDCIGTGRAVTRCAPHPETPAPVRPAAAAQMPRRSTKAAATPSVLRRVSRKSRWRVPRRRSGWSLRRPRHSFNNAATTEESRVEALSDPLRRSVRASRSRCRPYTTG